MDREELIRHLEEETKMLRDEAVKRAFIDVDRKDFLEEDYFPEAYEDYAVPIGHEATITKPSTAAFMLELLGLEAGDRVLNVGAGSGWTTALISNLIGDEGYVWATEIVPELVEKSRENLKKYDIDNALVIEAVEGDALGFPQDDAYDKILVHASVPEIPLELVNQLRVGGVMVIPVGDSLVRVERVNNEEIEERPYPGFIFEPLVGVEAISENVKDDDGDEAGSDGDDDDAESEAVPDYE